MKLNVSPKITAECGKQVTLNCDVSSSPNGLSIKHMAWIQNQTSLCSVDEEGKIKPHSRTDFHCEYKHGQLSLIFKRVRPLESGNSKPYTCKLQSNRGASNAKTIVVVQGQCQQCVTHPVGLCVFLWTNTWVKCMSCFFIKTFFKSVFVIYFKFCIVNIHFTK